MDYFKDLQAEIEACSKCELKNVAVNKTVVKNTGNLMSKIVFVGLAPSAKDHSEECFCTETYPTTQVFVSALKTIGLTRSDVYVTNIVKCSTIGNSSATDAQIKACKDFLSKELCKIKPLIVVAMGRQVSEELGTITGKVKMVEIGNQKYATIGIYHPAAIVRNNTLLPDFLMQFREIKKYVDNQTKNNTLTGFMKG